MYQILLTDNFVKWLDSLKDPTTKRRLTRRLEKAEQGNLGDVKSSQKKDIKLSIELAKQIEDRL